MSVNWSAWGLFTWGPHPTLNLMRVFTCGSLTHWLRVIWSGLHHWLNVDWVSSRSCKLNCSSDHCICFLGACIVSGVGGRVKKKARVPDEHVQCASTSTPAELCGFQCSAPPNPSDLDQRRSQYTISPRTPSLLVLTPHSPWAKEKQVLSWQSQNQSFLNTHELQCTSLIVWSMTWLSETFIWRSESREDSQVISQETVCRMKLSRTTQTRSRTKWFKYRST